MSTRVRVVQYVVQPILVADDGENLTPLEVKPMTVPAAAWAAFVESGLGDALAKLEADLNADEPTDRSIPPG